MPTLDAPTREANGPIKKENISETVREAAAG